MVLVFCVDTSEVSTFKLFWFRTKIVTIGNIVLISNFNYRYVHIWFLRRPISTVEPELVFCFCPFL
jgi:hypothetical protein